MANPPLVQLDSPAVARLASGLRPLLVLVGIAAAVAAGVTVVLWSQGPNWGLLYGGLSPGDANDVAQALQSANVPYKVDAASGGILVPQDRISDARLRLAAQGLPAGDGAGLELIRKDPGFGVSQFMEAARYHHALEIELARTITSLQAVEAARVHLAVPPQSAFIRSRRAPSASVFLRLKSGRRLEPEQVSGIVHLVASSIPELEAEQVTVVDQNGHLLSAPRNGAAAGADAQLEAARRLEETYIDRIEELLAPLVGAGRVRAQVAVDLDAGAMEEAREQYRPDSQIARSEQLAEQTAQAPFAGVGGIPGALTNQPPQAGVALPPGAAAGAGATSAPARPASGTPVADGGAATVAAAGPVSSSRQSTRNFEIDRTLSYSRQPPGRVRRVTVAVLVDHVKSTGPDGQPVSGPLAPEQLANVTQLVKDVVGFDATRGDSVNVVNASFLEPGEVPVAADVPLWQQPLLRDVARLVLGAVVVIVLLLLVVRPLLRSLVGPVRGGSLPLGATLATAQAVPGGAPPPAIGYEQQLAQARGLVTQDPKRVAQVVKGWVNSDG